MEQVRLDSSFSRAPRAKENSIFAAGRCAVALLALAGVAGLGTTACNSSHAGAGRRYSVRARITALPDAGSDPGTLTVRHEAIDHFLGHAGKVVGMDSMEMPFPLARGVPLQGIAAGDAVELTLHVDWSAEREIEIIGVRKLPPGTPLDFHAARP